MPDYFTLEEFRELPQMGDSDKYTDARVDAVAAALTSIIERKVGTSFVSRTYTKALPLVNGDVVYSTPYILETTSVSDDTSALSDPCGWGTAHNVTVTYEAGYSAEPPADIKEALMWAVRDRLLATSSTAGIDARRTSLVTEQGTVNYVLAGADNPTGYPDLDAAILGWHKHLFGLGFA